MTGGPPVREPGWHLRGSRALRPPGERAARVDWLAATLRHEAPDVPTELETSDGIWLRFVDDTVAQRFHEALLAENIAADLTGPMVGLVIEAWYSDDDVESMALAVAKVRHYLVH